MFEIIKKIDILPTPPHARPWQKIFLLNLFDWYENIAKTALKKGMFSSAWMSTVGFGEGSYKVG